MKRWTVILGIILTIGVLGYYFGPRPLPDLRPSTDVQIHDWIDSHEQKEAIPFLEQGGKYADRQYASQQLDSRVILPLLHRIRDEVGSEPIAVLMKERADFAGAIAVPMPKQQEKLRLLHTIFVEADEAFPGVILRQYGHDYMHFDIMDEKFARSSNIENWHVE